MAATLTWTAGNCRIKIRKEFCDFFFFYVVAVVLCFTESTKVKTFRFLFQKVLRGPHTDVFGHMNVPEIPEVLKFSTKYSVSAISAAPLKCVFVQCASKSLKLFLQS